MPEAGTKLFCIDRDCIWESVGGVNGRSQGSHIEVEADLMLYAVTYCVLARVSWFDSAGYLTEHHVWICIYSKDSPYGLFSTSSCVSAVLYVSKGIVSGVPGLGIIR